MAEYIYIDNSNLFIEGQRVSAVREGLVEDIWAAFQNKTLDLSYAIDFGKLFQFLAGQGPPPARIVLFGSGPVDQGGASVWQCVKHAGFELVWEARNAMGKEKKIDIAIATAMVKDAYTRVKREVDVITLVSGDGDFVAAVRELKKDGFRIEVVFWNHCSGELKRECSKFVSLDERLDFLKLQRTPRLIPR